MLLIGVDYHPSFQQIAFFDEATGECGERQLHHSDGEAERFYRDLWQRGIRVRVGMDDLTGVFCTSGSEREFTLKGRWHADEEIQAGADRDAAAAD